MVANTKKIPSKIIIDASLALAFLLPDEDKGKVEPIFEAIAKRKAKALVPSLFYFEVGNGLRSAVLSKRITKLLANKLLENFLLLPFEEKETGLLPVFNKAVKHQLSVYDATYLNLAQDQKVPLFSLDKKLTRLANKF